MPSLFVGRGVQEFAECRAGSHRRVRSEPDERRHEHGNLVGGETQHRPLPRCQRIASGRTSTHPKGHAGLEELRDVALDSPCTDLDRFSELGGPDSLWSPSREGLDDALMALNACDGKMGIRASGARRHAGVADNGLSGTEDTVRSMTVVVEAVSLQTRLSDLTLTPFTAELAPPMQEAILASGDQLSRWMTWWHEGFTETEAREWAAFCEAGQAAGTHHEFALQTTDCPYVGSCALSGVDRAAGTANLAYWTRSDYGGRGMASAAARRTAAWGVAALGLQRIEVAMATANLASRRVAERTGAVLDGVMRNRVHVRGKSYNFALYSLSPADFHADELVDSAR
jgi:ribosomal-protein-serine acetyltransferase